MARTETARRSIGSTRNPETEQAILEAARQILTEEGYGGFSIEAVARRARAGKPTIYRWWPSKADLMLDVYTRIKAVDMVDEDTGALETDIIAFLTNLMRFWQGPSGRVFRSLIAEAQSDQGAAEALNAYSAGRIADTAKLFERARQRGEVRADADSVAAAEIVAAMAWKLLLTDRAGTATERIAQTAAIVTRGLAP